MGSLVEDARAYLGLTLEEVLGVLGPEARAFPGDEYGAMHDVTSVNAEPTFPGKLYLDDGRVELVRVSRRPLADLSRADLDAQFGADAIRLRSRSGKKANLWVHAEQGVAYSAQGDTLDFLEVFGPRSQAAYEAEIYADPGAFIR